MRDESSIISDIEIAKRLIDETIKEQTSPISDLNIDVTAAINSASAMLTAINSIKTQLCRLPLGLCEVEYINNCINPLVTILFFLSSVSFELSIIVSILTFSPIVPPKESKLKNTIHLIYDINEECEELYNVLKRRLEELL